MDLWYKDGSVQECGISSALAMEIPQSHTKSSVWHLKYCMEEYFDIILYINCFVQDYSNSIANAQELLQSCTYKYINGLVQDCSALALELLQSCTKPLICGHT